MERGPKRIYFVGTILRNISVYRQDQYKLKTGSIHSAENKGKDFPSLSLFFFFKHRL